MSGNCIRLSNDVDSNSITIDTTKNSIIIIENGVADLITPPPFGTVEIPLQNNKIGNITIKNTIKRA